MPNRCIIAVDVGGTSIKSALVTPGGVLVPDTLKNTPVDANTVAGDILDTFANVINTNIRKADDIDADIDAVGIAICGPFNYADGISLMQRDKYVSLYDMNIKEEIRKRLRNSRPLELHFAHDVGAFLVGEIQDSRYATFHRIICVTLGTGIGSAFMVQRIVKTQVEGLPKHSIGRLPYQGGVLEDRIGRKGLLRRFRQLSPDCPAHWDVKDIFLKATVDHDRPSELVFEELGAILGLALEPIASSFCPDCLIVAGQISGAFKLIEPALKEELQTVKSLRMICRAQFVATGALQGVTLLSQTE